MNTLSSHSPQFTYGITTQPKKGYKICGDQYLIKKEKNAVLIAVTDGLGHGEEAYTASKTAINILKNATENASLVNLIYACDNALKETHGAVILLIKIENNLKLSTSSKLSWTGIGNIAGYLFRKHSMIVKENKSELLLSQSGVIGTGHLPFLKVFHTLISSGDRIILATDGIRTYFFEDQLPFHILPQNIADKIFLNYFDDHDDGLVLVLDWK